MNLEEAKLKLSKYGQEQILRYYDELSDDEKAALLEQIDKTDMEVLSDFCLIRSVYVLLFLYSSWKYILF